VGWKLNEYVSLVSERSGGLDLFLFFGFWFLFFVGLCVGGGSLVQAASGKNCAFTVKTFATVFHGQGRANSGEKIQIQDPNS
jgi:hypothetical protein